MNDVIRDKRLTEEQIERLAIAFATLPSSSLAALPAVLAAARRGSATAMPAKARAELERGMAALEAIIQASGAQRG